MVYDCGTRSKTNGWRRNTCFYGSRLPGFAEVVFLDRFRWTEPLPIRIHELVPSDGDLQKTWIETVQLRSCVVRRFSLSSFHRYRSFVSPVFICILQTAQPLMAGPTVLCLGSTLFDFIYSRSL